MTTEQLPSHYYHCYVPEKSKFWAQAARCHFMALDTNRFQGKMTVTLVGTEEKCYEAAEIMKTWASPGIELAFYRTGLGWEDVTLNRMHEDAASLPDNHYMLYAHAKGSFHPGINQEMWRDGMIKALLGDWPSLLGVLEHGKYDVAGRHYLLPEEFPVEISRPMFAGNYWWVRASHLKSIPKLPALDHETRGLAEIFVTQGNPKVLAMSRTWPNYAGGQAE